MGLADQQCIPCRGGVPPLKGEQLGPYLSQLPDWRCLEEHHIEKVFPFSDFAQGLEKLKERAEKSYAMMGAHYTEGAKSPVEGAIKKP